MILNKPYSPRDWADFAAYCNDNNLDFVDRGDYIESIPYEPSVDELKASVRKQRDRFLAESDKRMLEDFPLTEEERESWRAYRQYLRNIPESGEGWWQESPMTYEEWKDEPAL